MACNDFLCQIHINCPLLLTHPQRAVKKLKDGNYSEPSRFLCEGVEAGIVILYQHVFVKPRQLNCLYKLLKLHVFINTAVRLHVKAIKILALQF